MEIEQFKSFVKTIPAIKEDVVKGRYTWQQLYEIYTLYGENDKIWEPYKKTSIDINGVFNIFKNIDLNAVSQGCDGILKILDIVSQFSNKETKNVKQWFDD